MYSKQNISFMCSLPIFPPIKNTINNSEKKSGNKFLIGFIC